MTECKECQVKDKNIEELEKELMRLQGSLLQARGLIDDCVRGQCHPLFAKEFLKSNIGTEGWDKE